MSRKQPGGGRESPALVHGVMRELKRLGAFALCDTQQT